MVRSQREGARVGGDGFARAVEVAQGDAAVIEGRGVVGAQPQGVVVAGQRVLVPAEAALGVAEVEVRRRVGGIDGDGFADQLGGGGVVAVLVLDQTQHVQGIELAGRLRKDVAVEVGCVLQLPLPMEGRGLHQEGTDILHG